jgi:hypothetical protein
MTSNEIINCIDLIENNSDEHIKLRTVILETFNITNEQLTIFHSQLKLILRISRLVEDNRLNIQRLSDETTHFLQTILSIPSLEDGSFDPSLIKDLSTIAVFINSNEFRIKELSDENFNLMRAANLILNPQNSENDES